MHEVPHSAESPFDILMHGITTRICGGVCVQVADVTVRHHNKFEILVVRDVESPRRGWPFALSKPGKSDK